MFYVMKIECIGWRASSAYAYERVCAFKAMQSCKMLMLRVGLRLELPRQPLLTPILIALINGAQSTHNLLLEMIM